MIIASDNSIGMQQIDMVYFFCNLNILIRGSDNLFEQ